MISDVVGFVWGDSGCRNLDRYDFWSRPGGPSMITVRFKFFFAPSQLLVRANYLDRTLLLVLLLVLSTRTGTRTSTTVDGRNLAPPYLSHMSNVRGEWDGSEMRAR
jgi:hypothetical protein